MNHKKNSFLGDTYIKTKEGEIVIRAGMKLAIGWVIFALLCSCYVYAFFIRKPKIVPGENNTVELRFRRMHHIRKVMFQRLMIWLVSILRQKQPVISNVTVTGDGSNRV